ncbi:hypothetical protein AURDEDRAFT_164500 [Auricularia subglabra TFB-10046 SS5]|nr:hypothetical protein AURDEDRAFT_164500 [Auricularia subglabra TFB-10046 SS5]
MSRNAQGNLYQIGANEAYQINETVIWRMETHQAGVVVEHRGVVRGVTHTRFGYTYTLDVSSMGRERNQQSVPHAQIWRIQDQ